VDVLVDGAHAPGMVPLAVDALGAAYYVANLHKWVCAPKGAGFLHVRADRRADVHPLSISHGHRFELPGVSRYRLEFDWTGTDDPSPWLTVPAAIDVMAKMVPGGWPAVRQHNHALAVLGRRILCDTLGVPAPCPEEMVGSMASVPLPPGDGMPPASPLYLDPIHEQLLAKYAIEVPVIAWPAPPQRVLRISAQLYNAAAQYERLADALVGILGR
jgi:isopenicillin-N epimerase